MSKSILITGSTDGIGFETLVALASLGHRTILHGRDAAKVERRTQEAPKRAGVEGIAGIVADLSDLGAVRSMIDEVASAHPDLGVVISNAGVFQPGDPMTSDGLDVRFAVNAIAPYLIARDLLALVGPGGRVVNLSSAAQAPVDLSALGGPPRLGDQEAYAQSKLGWR